MKKRSQLSKHRSLGVSLCMAVAFGAMTASAAIVHSPVEMLATGKSGQPDSRGAVWTASRVLYAADALSVGKDLAVRSTAENGLIGYVARENEYPRVMANAGSSDIAESIGVVHPGEVFMHPLSPSLCSQQYGDGYYRARLTFTVPRNGFYSLNAQFRAIGAQGVAHIDTQIALGGFPVLQEEIYRNDIPNNTGRRYSLSHKFLRKGTEISMVVGPGWYDENGDSWWCHGNDATALALEIVEEDPEAFADEAVEAVASLGTTLLGATTETAAGGTIVDSTGIGTWSIYNSDAPEHWTTPEPYRYSLDKCNHELMSVVSATTLGSRGVRFQSARTAAGEPHLQVCGFDSVGDSGYDSNRYGLNYGMRAPIGLTAPGEVVVHPGEHETDHACVTVRFTPKEAGAYVATAKIRDITADQNNSAYNNGIKTKFSIGGAKVAFEVIGYDRGDNAANAWSVQQSEIVHLAAGEPVDLMIDPYVLYYSDGTGLMFDIVKLADASVNGFDATTAVNALAEASSGSLAPLPFASQGAMWSVGSRYIDSNGEFAPMSAMAIHDGGFRYFKGDSDYPRIYANASSQPLAGCLEAGENYYVYPGEFTMHPGANANYAVLRFVAPSDGVYSAQAVCRDVNNGTYITEGWQTGVDCLLMANDGFVASGVANVEQNADSKQQAKLGADRLYLKAGEPLDLCVGMRNLMNNDGTAARLFVQPVATKQVVSLDINAGASATYSGLGRVGFRTSKPWAKLDAEEGTGVAEMVGLRKDSSGKRTVVGFSVAPAQGSIAVANGEGNALMADGISAASDQVVYNWSVTGLEKNAAFTFYLYGTGGAVFGVGSKAGTVDGDWFTDPTKNDGTKYYTVMTAESDSTGTVSGTFRGSAEAAGVFCGLQIEGDSFKERTGLVLIVE